MKNCEWCSNLFDGNNRFCNISCKNTYISNLPQSKKIHKDNIIKLNKGLELRSKNSNRMKGNSNTLGYKWSKESREKLSKSIKKSWLDPERITKNKIPDSKKYKSGNFYSIKTSKLHHYRSSYELEFLYFLEQNTSIDYFITEPFYIPYLENERKRHYIPDYLIELTTGQKFLIEIKPKKFLYKLEFKAIAAINFCKNNNLSGFIVLTEQELQILKNINFNRHVS